LDELKQAGSGKTEQQLRNVLGCFLFSDEDQFKKIKVLSGGEKSRVALAKTLISEANFLLLDEPTNHLDFISENILIQALEQYQGTFVVVSHNRHFISQVANKIWYIEDYQIKEYPGTYEEYDYWKKKREAENKIQPDTTKPGKPVKRQEQATVSPKPSNGHSLKPLQHELEKVEQKIEQLTAEKNKLEEQMTQPEVFSNYEKLNDVQIAFDKVTAALDEANNQWEKLALELDERSKSI